MKSEGGWEERKCDPKTGTKPLPSTTTSGNGQPIGQRKGEFPTNAWKNPPLMSSVPHGQKQNTIREEKKRKRKLVFRRAKIQGLPLPSGRTPWGEVLEGGMILKRCYIEIYW